jgi:hypothetical protein
MMPLTSTPCLRRRAASSLIGSSRDHVPTAKIQLKGQFAIDRDRAEPLSLQIVHQLQEAIEAGRVALLEQVLKPGPSRERHQVRIGLQRRGVSEAIFHSEIKGVERFLRAS